MVCCSWFSSRVTCSPRSTPIGAVTVTGSAAAIGASLTIQSIYGALSAYMVIGLMFAACYAAMQHLVSDHFASGQPATTQPFQYFSFTTLTTLGYGDSTAAGNAGGPSPS
jgi:hypothetical protein